MKVLLHSSEDLELTEFAEPGFEIEPLDPHANYSALQMFATSLALCTYSVLAGYAEQIDTGAQDISVRVRWSYAEEPFRIGYIDMDVRWPGLPESRVKAAKRAAAQCTLHNTLEHPPEVDTEVHD